MKKMIIAFFVFLMLIIVGVFIVIYEPQGFTEETPFGNWESDIKITYTDGTTETLGINQPYIDINTMLFQGKEINNVEYCLKAKATGKGYTGCEIDLTDMDVKPEFLVDGNSIWSESVESGDVENINLNKEFVNIFSYNVPKYMLDGLSLNEFTSGKLYFKHTGSIRFRGLPDGSWADSNLPADCYLLLDKKPNPQVEKYTLRIETVPNSCYVRIDDNDDTYINSGSNGVASFLVEKGNHKVDVSKQYYNEKTIYVDVNGDTTKTVTLTSMGPHTLVVLTDPYSCNVKVGGVGTKNSGSNGKTEFELDDGYYQITVSKSGYITKNTGITINGEDEIKYVSLDKENVATYTLKVYTNPPYASLLTPKEAKITAPSYHSATIGDKGVIIFNDLPAGDYLVYVEGIQIVLKNNVPTFHTVLGSKWKTVTSNCNLEMFLSDEGNNPLSLVKTKFFIETKNIVITPYYTSNSKYLGSP